MIWIIAGTQDGREIAAALADRSSSEILVTVVSRYGKQLAQHDGLDIEVGRFTQDDMLRLIHEKGITLILDASHPYAAIVSKTAREACRKAGISYLRYERPEVALPAYDKLYHAENEEAAAEIAGRCGKRILLTTGSKTLKHFILSPFLKGKEIWARVLPVSFVIKGCEELGMQAKYIIAMQGPFSREMNRALIRDIQADAVIMKNSGLIGGSDTKLQAATEEGISVIVIDRPQTESAGTPVIHSKEEVLSYMEAHYGIHKESKGN